ncbi:adenylate/guanylate cyclase domain-containing protein [Campylobacter sp. 2018MI13]|uniref:adenylate/guanylate cyclase domain-containing protein n=1 Tax=Campylobacter sp. 2018MI13 TaxID=2836737 RepID=UPI001BDA7E8D|nr:adenylate/guanylate cyclase domain-containing protein [Campylobacter sp. 2018MI13]MBT0882481.1 hypothetical protein [Campylobacter sp. 2018MI13]
MDYNKFIDELYEEFNNKQDIKYIKSDTINLSKITLETNKVDEINNVTCVFIDMENSTKMSMNNIEEAINNQMPYIRAFVRIFEEHDPKYIDIQGDGGFALFDGDDSRKKGIYAAITINTLFNVKLNMNIRIGIDCGTVYVKKAGKRGMNKEIWIGSPVCLASKLCNIKTNDVFNKIRMSKTIKEWFVKNIYINPTRENCLSDIDFFSTDVIWKLK